MNVISHNAEYIREQIKKSVTTKTVETFCHTNLRGIATTPPRLGIGGLTFNRQSRHQLNVADPRRIIGEQYYQGQHTLWNLFPYHQQI